MVNDTGGDQTMSERRCVDGCPYERDDYDDEEEQKIQEIVKLSHQLLHTKELLQTLELLSQMGSNMTKEAATARKEMDEVYAKLKYKLK